MKNISFDNPYWLLLLIPLLAGVLIPFFIAIRKDNKSAGVITSIILHILIVLLVGLGVAGTVITTVMTQTQVIVVADVSHSAEKNLNRVNEYIAEINANLPRNSQLGVVCFGKDYVLHTELGGVITGVETAQVDDSATDIASALKYAGTLLQDETAIKRVILLTDANETVSDSVSGMISAVEQLTAQNIAIDAVYLDSNLREDAREVQLTGVEYIASTYLNHDATADTLIQSSYDTPAVVSLFQNGEKLTDRAVQLTAGYNVINFNLPTGTAGSFEYEVRVSADVDETAQNNGYAFTQTVSADVKVLFIGSDAEDVLAAQRLFGSEAVLDVYLDTDLRKEKLEELFGAYENMSVKASTTVPCSVEELCQYDEIVLANMDIRELDNVSAFVQSVETVVSLYGKSLVTVGDAKIQNKTDATLESLENMLPVKFGNSAQDPKLYALVIDTSRSMYTASRLAVAKQAAVHMLNLLDDDDDVIVVTFAGDIEIIQSATKAANREDIAKKINAIKPTQGTSIGGGLKAAVGMMLAHNHDVKQVMLISDGMNYTAEIVEINGQVMSPAQLATYMAENNVQVSTMNPYNSDATGINLLKKIAQNGNGAYYYLQSEKDLADLIFNDIADDVTESVIEKESLVHIKRAKDDVMAGISYLPAINGYVHSKEKVSANTVLTVDYEKANGTVVEVPLYAYWKYGNGKVASYTGTLSGDWVSGWSGTAGQTFMHNLFDANIPKEKIDDPYTLTVEYDGVYANVELIPAVLDPYATVTFTVTYPDGTVSEPFTPAFNATHYFQRFEAPTLGKYDISVVYTTKVGEFGSSSSFHITYSPEYDSFANFDASNLHAAIRHRGTVSEDAIPSLSNEDEKVDTYRLTFTVPFMIAAIVLYVIDIIIRKLRWSDIRTLFKKRAATGR